LIWEIKTLNGAKVYPFNEMAEEGVCHFKTLFLEKKRVPVLGNP
jgi:hypothetical protein